MLTGAGYWPPGLRVFRDLSCAWWSSSFVALDGGRYLGVDLEVVFGAGLASRTCKLSVIGRCLVLRVGFGSVYVSITVALRLIRAMAQSSTVYVVGVG